MGTTGIIKKTAVASDDRAFLWPRGNFLSRPSALVLTALVLMLLVGALRDADAGEGGAGHYALGINTPLAGIVPEPGTHYVNYFYFFDQSAPLVPDDGRLESDIRASGFANIFTFVHVTDWQVLGGDFGVALYVPFTSVGVDASVRSLLIPGLDVAVSDEAVGIGDLNLVPAIIGWHGKAWHAKAYFSFFAPTGSYSTANLADTGRNHWALDFGGAATWLDPRYGLELSGQLGYTVNFANAATNYRSGDELHVEWHVAQHLPFREGTVSLGLAGYAYRQVTGDSGVGALLGAFKGRVIALGPSLNLNDVEFSDLRFSVNFRYLKEFAVQNRLSGDVVWGTISFKF